MSIALFLLLAIGTGARANDAAPSNPCLKMNSNRQAMLDAAAVAEVDPACRAQIEASHPNCLKDPDVTDADNKTIFSQYDISQGSIYAKQTAAWREGEVRYEAARVACEAELSKIDERCATADAEIKARLKIAAADVAKARATPNAARLTDATQASTKIQEQLNATRRALAAAERAMNEQAACMTAQSAAMSGAIKQLAVNEQQELPTSEPSTETSVPREHVINATYSSLAPSTEAPTALSLSAPATTAGAAAEAQTPWYKNGQVQDMGIAVAGAAKLPGSVLGLGSSASSGDGLGAGQAAISVANELVVTEAATGVGSTLLRAGAGAWGGAIPIIMNPTPTGDACDGVDASNPARAAAGGCSRIVGVSNRSVNRATALLDQP